MVEMISELSHLSFQLSEQLHNLNKSIQGINEKLRSLDFGIEVWLSEVFLPSPHTGNVLGYCKVDDEWQLAVRTSDPQENGNGLRTALLKAPREVRVAALQFVPALLDVMKHEVQRVLLAISEAKTLADEL